MKRKIFSKLLMVALVIAAVGSFVSCKDYDDDINNLQKQIDAAALKSSVESLQRDLEAKITAAQTAANSAATAAAAAAQPKDVDAVKTIANDAATKAAQAIKDAADAAALAKSEAAAAKTAGEDAAKQALADAKAYTDEAISKIDLSEYAKTADVEEALKAYATDAELLALATSLKEYADSLKNEIDSNALTEERVKELIAAAGAQEGSIDAIWSAVTSIELVPSANATNIGQKLQLMLYKGKEVDNVFGGLDKAKSNDFQVLYQDGNELEGEIEAVTYEKDKEISFDNRVIVRVNPANAALDKDSILLINSLGETDINDYVYVKEVKDYNRLLTRAGEVATGLKVVVLARKAGVSDDDIAAASKGKVIDGTTVTSPQRGKTLFALGVKDGKNSRVLYTTFDLQANYGDYVAASNTNFYVLGDAEGATEILSSNLHNRWTGAKLTGEDKTSETPDGKKWFKDYAWVAKNVTKKIYTPAVDTLSEDGKGKNANYTTEAERFSKTLYVETDGSTRSFTIIPKNTVSRDDANNAWNNIQYYYVTLDKFAAVESAPSEYEAWKSYTYDGLYTITPATDDLTITVETASAEGDVVGFRVFAVNYDGTLVDPDGKSFYVQLGKPAAATKLTIAGHFKASVAHNAGDFKATNEPEFVEANAVYGYSTTVLQTAAATALKAQAIAKTPGLNVAVTAVSLSNYVNGKVAAADMSGFASIKEVSTTASAIYANSDKASKAIKAWYCFLDKDKKVLTSATELKNIAYVAMAYPYSLGIQDGATVLLDKTIDVIDEDHHNKVVDVLSLSMTKDMPTTADETAGKFTWKYTLGPDADGNLDIYPNPATATAAPWTSVAWSNDNSTIKSGVFDLTKIANNLVNTVNGTYTLTASWTPDDDEVEIFSDADVTAALGKAFTWDDEDAGAIAGTKFVFNQKYDASLNFGWLRISMDKDDDDAWIIDATKNYYYNVAVGGLTSITFKDAAEPANQTWSINPYNYSYLASAAATSDTQVSAATELFLDYNSASNTTGHWLTAANTTTLSNVLYKHSANNPVVTFAGCTNIASNYGDVRAEAVNSIAGIVLNGVNAVSFISATTPVSFTGNFNPAIYNNTTGHFAMVTGADAAITPGDQTAFRAKLISGTNTEYYNVAIGTNGALTFYKNTADTPAYSHEARLKVWAVDAFSRGAKRPVVPPASLNTGDEDGDPIIDIPVTIYVK